MGKEMKLDRLPSASSDAIHEAFLIRDGERERGNSTTLP